ncbi:hypothetical protein P7H06_17710 [Paenibacillus larvae]|nr:hypothetical protein [Paenibacillus larvae]MDT2260973.1 hypothetical protein [Paenibacillus larvae]
MICWITGKRGNWQRPTALTKSYNLGVPVKQAGMKICLWMRASFRICSRSIRKSAVESSRKLGTIDNELTRFRYDVMLRVFPRSAAREENRRPSLSVQKADIHGRMCGTVSDPSNLETRIEKLETAPDFVSAILRALAFVDNCWGSTNGRFLPRFTIKPTGFRLKGAMVEHRGMLNHLYAKIHDFRINRGQRHCPECVALLRYIGLAVFLGPGDRGKVVIYPE